MFLFHFSFRFENQLNNFVISQNQGLNKLNLKLGVFAVLFKFSLVAEIGKLVLLMEQNTWIKIM